MSVERAKPTGIDMLCRPVRETHAIPRIEMGSRATLSAMGVLTPVQTIVFLLLAVYTLPCEGMPNPNIQEGWTQAEIGSIRRDQRVHPREAW